MEKKRMTPDEARIAYPDEWVRMDELDMDESLPHIRSGVVIAHAKSRREVFEATRSESYHSRFTFFTGKVRGFPFWP